MPAMDPMIATENVAAVRTNSICRYQSVIRYGTQALQIGSAVRMLLHKETYAYPNQLITLII